MTTATANRGLEGIISRSNNSPTTSESSDSPSLISKIFSSAPYVLGAYYAYSRAREWMDFMNSDSSNNGDTSKGQWYQDAAIGGLQVLVLGLAATGAYNRLEAAHKYYSAEVDNFNMQESHLSGLAYALTYGEQPPQDFDFRNEGRLYNLMYKTLKTLRVHKLDEYEIGSYLMLNVLGMGSKAAKERKIM